MKGTCVKFFVHENRKHKGILLYEWLLETAKGIGIHGGSAFRAIAGYGRHGVLHEEHFFEMASDLTVEVVLFVNDDELSNLSNAIAKEKLDIFFVKMAVEYGVINGDRVL